MKIAFIGSMHSGKTTALDHVKEILESKGYTLVSTKFATPLYNSQKLFKPEKGYKNRKFLQELGDFVKKHFGENILAKVFTEYINKIENCDVNKTIVFCCDDVRVPLEFETVKKLKFLTVGIKTNDDIRKKRNPKLFIGTNHKTETSVNYLIEKCDFIIENNGTLEEFKNNLNKILFKT